MNFVCVRNEAVGLSVEVLWQSESDRQTGCSKDGTPLKRGENFAPSSGGELNQCLRCFEAPWIDEHDQLDVWRKGIQKQNHQGNFTSLNEAEKWYCFRILISYRVHS